MDSRGPSPCKIKLKLTTPTTIRDEDDSAAATANDVIQLPPRPSLTSSSSVSSPPSSPSSEDEVLQAHLKSQELVLYDPAVATNANSGATGRSGTSRTSLSSSILCRCSSGLKKMLQLRVWSKAALF